MSAERSLVNASLFVTCIVDQFYPVVGESTVRVLRRLGADVDFPSGQTCCGQPAFNSGFWADAKPVARRVLKMLRGDRYVVVPSGSCASMIRIFYPELFHDEPGSLAEARDLAPRVFELSEFIVDVLGVADIAPYRESAGAPDSRKVTYHEACHLRRELGVTTQPRTLITSAPGVELVEAQQSDVCCGFGGSFSVRYPDISGAMLQDKIEQLRETGAERFVSCDSGCIMHIAGGMERQKVDVRPMHIAELLDECLGQE